MHETTVPAQQRAAKIQPPHASIQKTANSVRSSITGLAMLIKNKVYPDCTISAINNFGYGVCRIEGIVVFVAGAVSGDVCDIQIIKTNKTWCVGKIRALRQRSSMRQEETFCCPHGNHCGGCIYDAITYEEELRLKETTYFTH